jgi:DNA-binding MarR family transcriptional regulator
MNAFGETFAMHDRGVKEAPSRNDGFPTILALLHVPYQAVIQQVQEDLAAAGYSDLGPVHFNVLPYLRPGGSRLVDVALAAQVSKQSMNYLIDHLEARGYVERIPDPLDGRAKIIRLTHRGRELNGATQKSLRKVESRMSQRLGDAEMRKLRELLLAAFRALKS